MNKIDLGTRMSPGDGIETIRNLAFMPVDRDADMRIDEYFASIPVKTRAVSKNLRLDPDK